ncbi:para-nitrobenzyl esterase [Saonia flava]|uniref:Carboxylic ester hydrolase n=1 Tax=Saonia flava TaxID=523696 RepID=A0A846QUJ0_9FLAO|nr:carboxylesterase family protein [Saonia flava]NJB70212.1 para-nitrobenzyl esterase [Saonia flava]
MNTRREFIKKMGACSTSLMLPGILFPFTSFYGNRGTSNWVTTEINTGKIRGIRNDGVSVFIGIPYAGKVSGNRRFRKPGVMSAWTGIRDTYELEAPAIQGPRRGEPTPAEDCLFLNVWTPANDGKKRPVMFYSHGGGFVIGSGGSAGQDGSNLARNFDVVVVETNHRLGMLGFMYLDEVAGSEYVGSGNMGLLDIVEGLKWVHENIHVFGGDPNNVMIFGESGGGAKTSCLYAMPDAAPYFNKASIESGPGVRMLTKDMAAQNTEYVLQEFGLTNKTWRKLLDIPTDEILKVQAKVPFTPPYQGKSTNQKAADPTPVGFGPVVDGIALPYHPFDPIAPDISKDKPLMVGWNEDEFTFFMWERRDTEFPTLDFDGLKVRLESQFGEDTPKIIETYRDSLPNASPADIYIAVSSITMIGLGSVEIAQRKLEQGGAPVYLYNFGYKSEVKIPGTDYAMGTPHAMDISFKFNNEIPPKEGEPDRPSFFGGGRPERFQASHNMAALWTSFAKNGRPLVKELPEWPAYSLSNKATMRIDAQCEIIKNRYAKELEMWTEIGRLNE